MGNGDPLRGIDRLSAQEQTVLGLIAGGNSTAEIAETLGISNREVVSCRSSIMEKLGIHSIAGLMKFCLRRGHPSL